VDTEYFWENIKMHRRNQTEKCFNQRLEFQFVQVRTPSIRSGGPSIVSIHKDESNRFS